METVYIFKEYFQQILSNNSSLIFLIFGLVLVVTGIAIIRAALNIHVREPLMIFSELHQKIANPLQVLDGALTEYRSLRETDKVSADIALELAFKKLGEAGDSAKSILMREHQYNDSDTSLGPVKLLVPLTNAVNECIVDAKNFDVNIRFQKHGIDEVWVYGTEKYLETIFLELIRNGIKYRDPKKEHRNIVVDGVVLRKYVMITIEDNGMGMTKRRLSRIGKSRQIKSARKAHVDGSGTGISNIKAIAKICKGKIDLDGDEDEGAEATVKLKRMRKA